MSDYLKHSILYCFFILLIFAWVASGSYLYGFLTNIYLTIIFVLVARGRFYNPSFWLPPFITLYNLSIFVLDYLGVRSVENHNEILIINIISLLGVAVAFINIKKSSALEFRINFNVKLIEYNLFLFFCLSFFACMLFIFSGASVKSEFSSGFISFFKIFNYFFCLLILTEVIQGNLNRFRLFSCVVFTVVSSMLLGERDILFSILVSLLIMYSFFSAGKNLKLYFIAAFLLFLIPVLGEYKNVFTKSEFKEIDYANYLVLILDGEFRSAGFNLEYILNNFKDDFFYGVSFFNDIMRSIVPGFIYEFSNSVGWYNKTYHPDIVALGRGYGFSLSAEGYINFGYFGVFIWFYIFASVIRFFYNRVNKNIYFFLTYLMLVPISIYSLRGDFSTFFSPLFKTVILPTLYFIFINKFFKLLVGFKGNAHE